MHHRGKGESPPPIGRREATDALARERRQGAGSPGRFPCRTARPARGRGVGSGVGRPVPSGRDGRKCQPSGCRPRPCRTRAVWLDRGQASPDRAIDTARPRQATRDCADHAAVATGEERTGEDVLWAAPDPHRTGGTSQPDLLSGCRNAGLPPSRSARSVAASWPEFLTDVDPRRGLERGGAVRCRLGGVHARVFAPLEAALASGLVLRVDRRGLRALRAGSAA